MFLMFRQLSLPLNKPLPDYIPLHNRIDFLLIIEMSLFIIRFYEMGKYFIFLGDSTK